MVTRSKLVSSSLRSVRAYSINFRLSSSFSVLCPFTHKSIDPYTDYPVPVLWDDRSQTPSSESTFGKTLRYNSCARLCASSLLLRHSYTQLFHGKHKGDISQHFKEPVRCSHLFGSSWKSVGWHPLDLDGRRSRVTSKSQRKCNRLKLVVYILTAAIQLYAIAKSSDLSISFVFVTEWEKKRQFVVMSWSQA